MERTDLITLLYDIVFSTWRRICKIRVLPSVELVCFTIYCQSDRPSLRRW